MDLEEARANDRSGLFFFWIAGQQTSSLQLIQPIDATQPLGLFYKEALY